LRLGHRLEATAPAKPEAESSAGALPGNEYRAMVDDYIRMPNSREL